MGHSTVDGHRVPVPHFGLVLDVEGFHATAERLRAAGTAFVIEPTGGSRASRGAVDDVPARPAGNALEFKAFRDPAQLFAT